MLDVPPQWRGARRVVAASSVLFLLVVCRWQPWALFQRAGFSNDFYEEQARSFWHLRLDVPSDVAGPEGFLVDGRTYLYYGPFLAVLRMPFVLFGQWVDERLVRVSMLAAYSLSCVAALRLLATMARRMGAQVSPRRAAWFAAFVAAGPTLSAAGWDSVYHETELWALALFLLTLTAALELSTSATPRAVAACGFLTIATVLTRASIGYGAIAAMLSVATMVSVRQRRISVPGVAWPLGALMASLLLNVAKFGTLLDLPADRQLLTLQNPARAAWFAGNGGSFFSVRFLPTTIAQYLRPDALRVERLAPFVRFGPLATEYGAYPLEGNTPSSSLPVAAGALVALAFIGMGIVLRRRYWWMVPVLLASLIAAVPTLLIGFVAQRYLIDLLPVVLVPAAVAVAGVGAFAAGRQRTTRVAISLALAWSVIANLAFATWISELKNPSFTSVRYAIDDMLFGGSAPSVVRLADTNGVPRDGIVAVDRGCAGLYIAEQGAWVPLERADGVRTLDVQARLISRRLSIATADGNLVVQRQDGVITARWSPAGGTAVHGSAAAAGDTTMISVVSDPVSGGLRAYADGRPLLAAMAAPDLGDAVLDGNYAVVPRPGSTQICAALSRRLDTAG